MEALLDWGYIGLFIGSFVAATIVPFSSDVLLVGILAAGGNVWLSVLVATVGNWAGGLTSYWIGWLPFIGDVFAVALGFYRVNFRKSAVLMLIGKGARFVCWALLFIWGKDLWG